MFEVGFGFGLGACVDCTNETVANGCVDSFSLIEG
jgi:hypothetical protein